jgi:hypothetical protein
LHGGGQGFESPRLHSEIPGFAGKTRGMDKGRRTNLGPRTATDTVTRLSRCVARYAAGAVTIGAEPPRVEAIMAALINELAAIPEELTFVLDDYYVIDSDLAR